MEEAFGKIDSCSHSAGETKAVLGLGVGSWEDNQMDASWGQGGGGSPDWTVLEDILADRIGEHQSVLVDA